MGKKSRVKSTQQQQQRVTTENQPVTVRETPTITAAQLRSPLDDLARAVRRRELTERRIGQMVSELREAGYSWALIGDQLNMTRQGARQRYAPDERPSAPIQANAGLYGP